MFPLSTENDFLILLFFMKEVKSANVFRKDETNCRSVMATEIRTCAKHNCCSYGFAEESMFSLVR